MIKSLANKYVFRRHCAFHGQAGNVKLIFTILKTNAERLKRTEEIYHAAMEFCPPNISRFLDEICGGDKDLRRKVESMLAALPKPQIIFLIHSPNRSPPKCFPRRQNGRT
jgi:hypothetical protein